MEEVSFKSIFVDVEENIFTDLSGGILFEAIEFAIEDVEELSRVERGAIAADGDHSYNMLVLPYYSFTFLSLFFDC